MIVESWAGTADVDGGGRMSEIINARENGTQSVVTPGYDVDEGSDARQAYGNVSI